MNIKSMVDRLGDLDSQLKAVDSLLLERDALRKQLAEHADTLSDNEETLRGIHYSVVFSKPPINHSIIDVAGYLNAVGIEGFLGSVKVSVTTATKLLSKNQQADLFVKSKGARRLKAIVANNNDSERAAANFFNTLSVALAGGNLDPATRLGPNH